MNRQYVQAAITAATVSLLCSISVAAELSRYDAKEIQPASKAARKGVRVNALCPGPVTETVMSQKLGATLAKKMGISPKEQLDGFLNTLLQGRAQTADEIATAALFLCSDQSSAITGQSINVDGGAAFF